ncbi:MAG: peptidase M20 [Blastocatellia bacterium AA13]|nr:MAG: peptidase M20 [Blastocatellia bacterium AA13]
MTKYKFVVTIALAMLTGIRGAAGPSSDAASAVRSYCDSHQAAILREFAELLAIPNVASDAVNIRRNAALISSMMERRGIAARLIEGKGSPVVFGELRKPGATRTIGIYAHYDGQPVDPATWTTPPFKPTLRTGSIESGGAIVEFPKPGEKAGDEWRLYARSASDDKAPIVALMAALDALKASRIEITSNLKFFFEGEEEAGSIHLEELLRRNKQLLDADAWICADGPVHQTRKQAVFFGCRGVVSATITVYGANRGLHSGHYGNWAPNAAMMLAKLLASMKDDSGRVLIAGFYEGIEPLGEDEKRAIREMPDSDAQLMREYGMAAAEGAGKSLAELINEPSLNVDGMRSEDIGAQARNIVPPEATATVDMRLVKGIEPARQLQRLIAHIEKQGFHVVKETPSQEMRLKYPRIARVTSGDGYQAARTPMSLPICKQVIKAVEESTGSRPVLMPVLGGSAPLAVFASVTGIPQIGVPIVNHDNNQHSSNENLRLKNLWDGIVVLAGLMTMK